MFHRKHRESISYGRIQLFLAVGGYLLQLFGQILSLHSNTFELTYLYNIEFIQKRIVEFEEGLKRGNQSGVRNTLKSTIPEINATRWAQGQGTVHCSAPKCA